MFNNSDKSLDQFFFSSGSDSKVSDVDGQPYTTLLYSNGPGYMHPRNILREAGKDSIQVREAHSHFRTGGRWFGSVYWIGEWSSGEIEAALENPSRTIAVPWNILPNTSDCLAPTIFSSILKYYVRWALGIFNLAVKLMKGLHDRTWSKFNLKRILKDIHTVHKSAMIFRVKNCTDKMIITSNNKSF